MNKTRIFPDHTPHGNILLDSMPRAIIATGGGRLHTALVGEAGLWGRANHSKPWLVEMEESARPRQIGHPPLVDHVGCCACRSDFYPFDTSDSPSINLAVEHAILSNSLCPIPGSWSGRERHDTERAPHPDLFCSRHPIVFLGANPTTGRRSWCHAYGV